MSNEPPSKVVVIDLSKFGSFRVSWLNPARLKNRIGLAK